MWELRLSPPEQVHPKSVFLSCPPRPEKQTCLESMSFYFSKIIHKFGNFPDKGLVLKIKGF